jgi:hypothetical protein
MKYGALFVKQAALMLLTHQEAFWLYQDEESDAL